MGSARLIATAGLAGVVVLATAAPAALLVNLNRGPRRGFEWRFEAVAKHFGGFGTRLDAIEARRGVTERARAGLEGPPGGLRAAVTGRRPAA